MKGKLIFNLDDIDDKMKFKRILKSDDMSFILFELLRNSKKQLEQELESKKQFDKYDTLEYVFDHIWKLVNEYNIDIDEIL